MTRAARHPRMATVVVRTLFDAPLLSAFLVFAIAATALVGTLVPPLIDQARTATVQHQLREIPEIALPLTAVMPGLAALGDEPGPRADAWAAPLAAAAAARAARPEPLRDVLGTPRVYGSFAPAPFTGDRKTPLNKVQVVMDPGLASRSTLLRGSYPATSDPTQGIGVVLTDKVAETLDWRVGETRRSRALTLTLTGVIASDGSNAQDWRMLNGSLEPLIELTPLGDRIYQGVAFMNPDEAPLLGELAQQAVTYSWIPLDGGAIDAGDADVVARQLRLMMATAVHIGVGSADLYDQGLLYSTPAADAMDQGVARGRTLLAIVAVAAVCPLAVAAVVLTLSSRQLASRRRRAARLMRARGASQGALLALLSGESLLLGVLGAVLGVGAGLLLVPHAADGLTLVIPALLVLVVVCAVPATLLGDLRRIERRSDGARTGARWQRILVEAVVVGLAAACAGILLTRGGGALTVDPVLLAVPLLIGAAGTVLVLRVLPPVLAALHRTAARRTGLIGLLGPARALRDEALRTAPALAAVIGIAVAVFSVAFAATVTEGISRHASESTGADIAVTVPYADAEQIAGARAVPGVAALATLDANAIGMVGPGSGQDRVRIYAVDRAEFLRVQQGFDPALPLPSALASTQGGPIPVVASEQLVAQFGDALTVNDHPVRIVARTAQPVPFGTGSGTVQKWVIIDTANLHRIGLDAPTVSQAFVSVAPGHDARAVAKAVTAALGQAATARTAAQIIAAAGSDPATAALHAALIAAVGIVALLLAWAVVQTLALGSAARARLLALLRAVGYPRRGELPLVAWEVGPALLVSVPIGLLTGTATARLVVGGLDLRGFTGGDTAPELVLAGWGTAAVVGGFIVVTGAAVLLATAAAARLRSAEAIRVADDED
ncbi:ABC transporter permease [Microbacterium panaciterrae]